MGKNIVICLDGTGNQVDARHPTNVVTLFRRLDLSDPSRQVAYYDPGVGTLPSENARGPIGERLSRLSGLAFGTGMRQNLAEAYTFLMHHWRPGDAVFVFGFSRGAYTARALVGMLTKPGLMRPGSENLVRYAVARYAFNQDANDGFSALARFASIFSWETDQEPLFAEIKQNDPKQVNKYTLPIAYVGLWDTVKAAGILRFGELRWPFTRSLPNAHRIRHAVSIDEVRRPYREYQVSRAGGGVEEVWFAGVHSDVGGTFMPDHRLARVALRWVADGALDQLLLNPETRKDDADLRVSEEDALGEIHEMGAVWRLLGTRRRPIPPGAVLHASVRARRQQRPDYLPELPADQRWADEGWADDPQPLAGD
jgi:uncharacterized protein (DUF2235 family)